MDAAVRGSAWLSPSSSPQVGAAHPLHFGYFSFLFILFSLAEKEVERLCACKLQLLLRFFHQAGSLDASRYSVSVCCEHFQSAALPSGSPALSTSIHPRARFIC